MHQIRGVEGAYSTIPISLVQSLSTQKYAFVAGLQTILKFDPFFCLFGFCFCFFQDRVSLCSHGCPGTHSVDQAGFKLRNPPASASWVLELKACTTTPGVDYIFFSRDRVSLYNPGCPGAHFVDQAGLKLRNLPASASRVLGLKAYATTPGSQTHS